LRRPGFRAREAPVSRRGRANAPRLQRGVTTLVVAILLLAILAIVTLLALQVGVFDQRTPATNARPHAAVADPGVRHASAFLEAHAHAITRSWMAAATRRWAPCARTDRTWPCGAEPDASRRETLERYQFGEDDTGTADVDERLELFAVDGGGDASSAVIIGGLLCMVDQADPVHPGCASAVDPAIGWDGPVAVTLVARASGSNAPAAGKVLATVGSYRVIRRVPDVAIIASGTLAGLGRAEAVPAPNAGGFGVPLSVWSNVDVDLADGGVMQTCHLGEFLANGGPAGAVAYDGITTCSTCRCDGLDIERGLISGRSASSGAAPYEGVDILDVDGSSAAAPRGALPDATFFPFDPLDDAADPLDDSLFEYVFGIDNASEDGSALVDADRDGKDDGRDFLEDVAQVLAANDCNGLDAATEGLAYVPPGVRCAIGGQVGTPGRPVALVVDGDLDVEDGAVVYGLLFVKRSVARSATVRVTGTLQLYGAIVVEGRLDMPGAPQFIYDARVLGNLLRSPALQRFGVLPRPPTPGP
jgi:hypothetical protein